jgi:hypothetical protein
MSAFDPPPYISKLIGAINDGAKSAQLGALVFVFIGLFLLATSFSATDEDLLIGTSISISQLGGVAVPVALSFGFMPAIFVALHLYTLIRFDLLMQNLRHFQAELRATVPLEKDRQSCLQLLANTEFIQAQLKPEGSFVFRWTYRFMLAVFPVGVLLLVQLSSLRLQDHVVNIIHHLAIALDLLLLVWFFWRQQASRDSLLRWLVARDRFLVPVAVLGFDMAWCHVPSVEATTVGPGRQAETLVQQLAQPVDLLLCRHVKIGCRYLAVPGRPLVGRVWDSNSFVELRAGEELNAKRRAAFDPLVLQGRRLRFADLSGSQLFAVDLSRAQLQGARLHGAQLQGASLVEAQLQGASLQGAQMQGASLYQVQLQGASLDLAQLQGARLDRAELQGASLDRAQLQGASLEQAELQGALIAGAKIWRLRAPNARLDDAQLRDLEFSDAAPCPDRVPPGEACRNPRSWAGWIEEWTKSIPAGQRRDAARQSLAVLTSDKAPEGAEAVEGAWNTHPTPLSEAVAKRLGDLACRPDHAPRIARMILEQIRYGEIRDLGDHVETIATRMLGDDCPGANGLEAFERARLTAIAAGRR